jgi:hypothetical protein
LPLDRHCLPTMNAFLKSVVTTMFNKENSSSETVSEISTQTRTRIKNLCSAKQNLMETIRFLKEVGASQGGIDSKLNEFHSVSSKLHDALTGDTSDIANT